MIFNLTQLETEAHFSMYCSVSSLIADGRRVIIKRTSIVPQVPQHSDSRSILSESNIDTAFKQYERGADLKLRRRELLNGDFPSYKSLLDKRFKIPSLKFGRPSFSRPTTKLPSLGRTKSASSSKSVSSSNSDTDLKPATTQSKALANTKADKDNVAATLGSNLGSGISANSAPVTKSAAQTNVYDPGGYGAGGYGAGDYGGANSVSQSVAMGLANSLPMALTSGMSNMAGMNGMMGGGYGGGYGGDPSMGDGGFAPSVPSTPSGAGGGIPGVDPSLAGSGTNTDESLDIIGGTDASLDATKANGADAKILAGGAPVNDSTPTTTPATAGAQPNGKKRATDVIE
ncbi:hypothetical protein OnM2_070058 [Erysiphe neolycopersici]|uniref:Uncharacterized protein n=1 Tax=Erysiphe neolycopersici TaxID=212602 RepID=A0A420HKL9_9PEZI|nr:hypothetical protein OnM2_070058 [Erysiphe neolycopersici]